MNFAQVQAQLNDLPLTFKRPGQPYSQWVDALTAGLVRYSGAVDQLLFEVQSIANGQFGYLDIWGMLFGIIRRNNESDDLYRARIIYIITAGGGTPTGMATWIKHVWNVDATITEDFVHVGYVVTLFGSLTLAQIIAIIQSLIYIRPAGVPFRVASQTVVSAGGMYIETINFVDFAPYVTGAYLASTGAVGASGVGIPLNAATDNAQPILPDLFLTDPTLNPNLPAA